MAVAEAGWYVDPTGRADARQWNGATWTREVRTGAELRTDAATLPRGAPAAAAAVAAPVAPAPASTPEPATPAPTLFARLKERFRPLDR